MVNITLYMALLTTNDCYLITVVLFHQSIFVGLLNGFVHIVLFVRFTYILKEFVLLCEKTLHP